MRHNQHHRQRILICFHEQKHLPVPLGRAAEAGFCACQGSDAKEQGCCDVEQVGEACNGISI